MTILHSSGCWLPSISVWGCNPVSYQLTRSVNLYEPGAEVVDEVGHRAPGPFTEHFTKAMLVSTAGSVTNEEGLVIPDDRRRYIVRHIGTLDTDWYLKDDDDNWFAVDAFFPPAGSRRRGFLTLVCSYIPDPELDIEMA